VNCIPPSDKAELRLGVLVSLFPYLNNAQNSKCFKI